MSLDFTGAWAVPGLETIRENTENVVWFGKFDQQVLLPAVIDSSALDDTSPSDDVIKQGTVLGQVTSSKKLKLWNPTATTGEEKIYGVLLNEVKMGYSGTARDRYVGWVLVKGNLKASGVRIQSTIGDATVLLSAGTSPYEPLFRALATQNGQFILDDEPFGRDFGGWSRRVDKTADYTVTEGDSGTIFTNKGATGAVIWTLPSATLSIGCRYLFIGLAAQNWTITAAPTDTLIGLGDAAADTLSFSTASEQIGGGVEVLCLSATEWLMLPHRWEAQTCTLVS